MPVLAYCITESEFQPVAVPSGVAGAVVETLTEGDLRCFISEFQSQREWNASEAALEFHHVLQDVFSRTAIVPFRFPTVLANESKVREYLCEHSQEFREALHRFRDSVQMEIQITPKIPRSEEQSKSGREYLQQRQARFRALEQPAARLQELTAAWARDWRQKANSQGLRCYALVKRVAAGEFQQTVREFAGAAEVNIRVSGPWAATEFMSLPASDQPASDQRSLKP